MTDDVTNKTRKICFSIQKMLHRPKETTINVYLKLIDSLIKSIILFVLGRTPLNINIEMQMLKHLNDLLLWKRTDTFFRLFKKKV